MDLVQINALLPFLLRRENVARYEDGVVVIGDRRKYPFEKSFVRCTDVEGVARAIEEMVTQGGGPANAALYAMALAARQCARRLASRQKEFLESARRRLVATRPTNTALARRLEKSMQIIETALSEKVNVEQTLLTWIEKMRDEHYQQYATTAEYGASLIEDGDGILTMCFAETSFLLALALARDAGKNIHVFTPETRL